MNTKKSSPPNWRLELKKEKKTNTGRYGGLLCFIDWSKTKHNLVWIEIIEPGYQPEKNGFYVSSDCIHLQIAPMDPVHEKIFLEFSHSSN